MKRFFKKYGMILVLAIGGWFFLKKTEAGQKVWATILAKFKK